MEWVECIRGEKRVELLALFLQRILYIGECRGSTVMMMFFLVVVVDLSLGKVGTARRVGHMVITSG